ncbi:MAG: cobyrinate a,c-diamide synthase [Deltaproteobacteria bacterium]|nr:cobyrinate a,c-diamide synthase [Deltaproteobacteria bacterium]
MLIAAPASGSGKTTLTLALIAAARRRGLVVQPFKVGPDFIDPGHHARLAGRPARTLDGWMLGADACRASMRAAMASADVAIVEGMMGLFDGLSSTGDAGSTAEIAKWLDLPVLLVLDAGAMARSAAAVVRGFRDFDLAVTIAGVVFNRIGGAGHLRLLRDALAAAGLPPCLGGFPVDAALALPERHLGLFTAAETTVAFDVLADAAERHLDVDEILRLATAVTPLPKEERAEKREGTKKREGTAEREGMAGVEGRGLSPRPDAQRSTAAQRPRVRAQIAIARDEAFSFYYPENLELLAAAGAEIVEFSPLCDMRLPSGTCGLYLGGGYPEVHAARLAANLPLLEALRAFAAAGGLVYAECGGLMLLGDTLEDETGRTHAMAGVLPLRTRMLPQRLTLGYREVTIACDFLPPLVARGHEFHGSTLDDSSVPVSLARAYVVGDPATGVSAREGFTSRRTLASYVHLHFASAPALAGGLVAAARAADADLAAARGTSAHA